MNGSRVVPAFPSPAAPSLRDIWVLRRQALAAGHDPGVWFPPDLDDLDDTDGDLRAVWAPTAGLFEHLGFPASNPWVPEAAPAGRALIEHALRCGWEEPEPFRVALRWTPRQHLGRIATLVRGWDPALAAPLNVEVDEYACGSIFDGCHRLSAAWFRRHPFVLVLLSGYVDEYPAFLAGLGDLASGGVAASS